MNGAELRVCLDGEVISSHPLTGNKFTLPGGRIFSLREIIREGGTKEVEYKPKSFVGPRKPGNHFNLTHTVAQVYDGSAFEVMSCGRLSWMVGIGGTID